MTDYICERCFHLSRIGRIRTEDICKATVIYDGRSLCTECYKKVKGFQ